MPSKWMSHQDLKQRRKQVSDAQVTLIASHKSTIQDLEASKSEDLTIACEDMDMKRRLLAVRACLAIQRAYRCHSLRLLEMTRKLHDSLPPAAQLRNIRCNRNDALHEFQPDDVPSLSLVRSITNFGSLLGRPLDEADQCKGKGSARPVIHFPKCLLSPVRYPIILDYIKPEMQLPLHIPALHVHSAVQYLIQSNKNRSITIGEIITLSKGMPRKTDSSLTSFRTGRKSLRSSRCTLGNEHLFT